MSTNDKVTPLLKKDLENEQNIENQNYPGEPNSKPEMGESASEDPKKVPESNDPAGYSKKGIIKKSPFKK